MAVALTMVVATMVAARTTVIGIASDTTTMTTDTIAEAGAIIHQVDIGPITVANEAGQFKAASASHIAATEIHFRVKAAEVGGLFHFKPQTRCPLLALSGHGISTG
jgi:hypothetical protein